MRVSTVAAAVLVALATLAITGGALSATAAPRADPAPSATGSSQISFTVPETASPAPSGSSSTSGSTSGSTNGSAGGSTAHGGGDNGSGGSAGGVGVGGTSTSAPVPSPIEPSIAPGPASNPLPLQLDDHYALQGASVIVSAGGFLPGEKVLIVLYSTPVKLGVFTVSATGQVSAEVTIPRATSLGKHHIQITGFQDGRVAGSAIEVGLSKHSGSSAFPGIVWIVAGGGIGLAAISILLAIWFGWLPNVFASGRTGRKLL